MPAIRPTTVIPAAGLAAVAAVVLAVTGGGIGARPSSGGGRASGSTLPPMALTAFDGCDAVASYYRRHATALVGPYGLAGAEGMTVPGTGGIRPRLGETSAQPVPGPAGDALAGAAPAEAAPAGATSENVTSAAGTTVQVPGVDEADLAKLSGGLLVTLDPQGHALRLLRATSGAAEPVGQLRTTGWSARNLLVDGTTVLLFGSLRRDGVGVLDGDALPDGGGSLGGGGALDASGSRPAPMPRVATRIQQVDISDPARPRVVHTLDVDGTQVGARLVSGTVRLAVSSTPGDLGLVPPQASGAAARQRALDANRDRVRHSSLDTWLPSYRLTPGEAAPGAAPGENATGSAGASPATRTGRLVSCTQVSAPAEFSGLDTVTLLSFDLHSGAGIAHWTSASVVASGSTMYATAAHTYITTAPWQVRQPVTAQSTPLRSQPGGTGGTRRTGRTAIHEFATEGAAAPRYLASGSVAGSLLGQFAMDEYHGVLRVASTTLPGFPQPVAAAGNGASAPAGTDVQPRPTSSSSQVTVLRRSGAMLRPVGEVGGLGAGEQIRAVRFIADTGYVVTFRQTDPLYTVDLADPAHPRVTGELKLLGYSAYLHPAGRGLLLGVGQDADGDGRIRGLQLSLFDVSDPTAPRRLAQVRLPQAWSAASSGEHHAFTLADGLVLVPYQMPYHVSYEPSTPLVTPGATPEGPTVPAPDATPRPTPARLDTGVLAVRLTGNSLGAPHALHAYRDGGGLPAAAPAAARAAASARPLRTFVSGGRVWTVTTTGIAVHDADTLAFSAFTPFAQP